MISKNKKIYLVGLAVVLAGLIFVLGASSARAATCSDNEAGISFSSFLNPMASLAEKVVKDFGYKVSLAAAPDPDFCGSDAVGCSGTTPTATINWEMASHIAPSYGVTYCDISCAYIVTISGIGDSPQIPYTTTSYSVSSGLANNTTYNWSVEAYYQTYQAWAQGYLCSKGGEEVHSYIVSSASCGYINQPYGSFTTLNCGAPPPTHNVCSGNLCVSVAGDGVDECSSNAQCVPSPDFSLNSSNNIYITILKEKTGESNTTNISITPLNGFNSPVTLSVQNQSPSLPSGSVVSFSPGGGTSQTLNSPYAGGSDFKVSIGPGLTSSQQYTLTVQGVDGGLINTTDVILNVLVKNPGWQEI